MTRNTRNRARLSVEQLESRFAPVATTTWQPPNPATDITWTNAGNWSNGTPDGTKVAIFDGGVNNSSCIVGTATAHDITIRNNWTGTLSIIGNSTVTCANEANFDNGAGHKVNIDFAIGSTLKISGADNGTSKMRDINYFTSAGGVSTAGVVEIAGGTTQIIGNDGGSTSAAFTVDTGATFQFSNTAPAVGSGAVQFKGGAGISNNGQVLIDDNNCGVAFCSTTDSPSSTFTNNARGTISFTSSALRIYPKTGSLSN